jgi:hypothetical protein
MSKEERAISKEELTKRKEERKMKRKELSIFNKKIYKEKRVFLTLLLALCYLLSFSPLFAVDVGLVLDQKAECLGSKDTEFSYTGVAIPRITGLVGDTGDYYISAGLNFQNGPWAFVPELLRADFNWQSGSMYLTVGRMSYDDPLEYIASGLFDGARFSQHTNIGTFSVGAWYTGLLYKKRANIEMTENENMAINTDLDYGDFANTYFAPRRVLAAFDWEQKGLLEKAITRLSLLGQFDLTEEKLNSQYLAGKIIIPYGAFTFDIGGCFELIEGNNEIGSAFAVEASAAWRHPIHYLALGAKYASGKTDSLSAFLPLTTNTRGHILEPKLSGLTMISLDYTARLNETYSVGFFPAYFMLNGSDSGGKNLLGAEIYAAFYWSPLPDISLNLGAGAFLPSLGNITPDEKASWRVEINVVVSLY